MRLQHFSFYHSETGLFHQSMLTCADEEQAARNTPAGYVHIAGVFDPLSQRVDIETGNVVDWQPAQPSADHTWDTTTRRWVLSASAAERERKRVRARARIAELEAKQARAVREHLLGIEPSEADRARGALTLREIDQEIARLRADLHA